MGGVLAFPKFTRVTTKPMRAAGTASVDLPRSADVIWSFMADAGSSAVLDDAVTIATTLPGSPVGLGEIQVSVTQKPTGRTAGIIEVVGLIPGRHAVTRSMDAIYPTYGELTVNPHGPTSCRLTQSFWMDFPVGSAMDAVRRVYEAYQEDLRVLMDRLEELAPTLPY